MSVQVKQNERFQRREWRLERIGWALVGAFVVAGLIGLLGTGPFSWATATSNEGLVTVDYQRVTHHEADDALELTFPADAVEDGTISVEITGTWLSGIDLQGVSPQPSEERTIPNGVVFEFAVERPGPTRARLTFRAQEYGTLSAEVTVRGDTVSLSQLVLP